ncbi:MAG: glycosyltransferase [Bauldia litoralis]
MIPRVIHQTWRDSDVPESLSAYADTWRAHHPRWTYRLWTDADLADLVETRFPELAAMFHGYPKAIMRVDLGRYLVLKAEGGVYADLDAEALGPWDGLSTADRPVFFEEPASHAAAENVDRRGFVRIVSNALIASPPGHPFWDHLVALLFRCRHARSPLDATGPFVLTAAIEQAPAAVAPEVLPAGLAARRDNTGVALADDGAAETRAPLADHHWAGTWWRDGGDWPSGFFDIPPPKESWPRRIRRHVAERRLTATVAAARTLDPDTPPPRGARVLVAVVVPDAAQRFDMFLAALDGLGHPRDSISLAITVSGGATAGFRQLRAAARTLSGRFARLSLHRERWPVDVRQTGNAPSGERARRAQLARMRNRLLRRALGDEDWVLWLDPGVTGLPPDLISRVTAANARIVQPNTVVTPGGPTADTRCWLSEFTLDEESMRPYRFDGLYLPPTGYARLYPSDLRYRDRMALDSVGGGALLVNAGLHRAGVFFPEAPYRALIDTEGFGAILRDRGFDIAGLTDLEVICADTHPSGSEVIRA